MLHLGTRGSQPSEQIMEYAKQFNAGLLVMGPIGRSRVREFVLG